MELSEKGDRLLSNSSVDLELVNFYAWSDNYFTAELKCRQKNRLRAKVIYVKILIGASYGIMSSEFSQCKEEVYQKEV